MCNEHQKVYKEQHNLSFRAKRERERKVTYDTNKCLYELPPFDDHFDPLVHNTYLNRWEQLMVISRMLWFRLLFIRKEQARVQNSLVMQSQLQREKNRIYRENNSRVKLTPVVCIIEIIVIGRY